MLEMCKKVLKANGILSDIKCSMECEICPFYKKNCGWDESACMVGTKEENLQLAQNYIKEHEKTVNTINSIEEQTITLDDLKDIKENNIVPKYYHRGSVDTIQFCLENNLNFLQGNIIKYVVRYKEKNGLEDLKKAQEYLRRLIENEEKKESDINE